MNGKKILCLGVVALGLVLAATSAHALSLTPGDAAFTTNDNSNCNAACFPVLTGLTELYKQNVVGGEEGSFAGSYTTAFQNTATDPSGFTITYVAGQPVISCGTCYLLVKDGNQEPAQYLFNISGGTTFSWNGTDTITGTGFWPNEGSISHLSIFGGPGTSTPEPASLMLLGVGMAGLGLWNRKSA